MILNALAFDTALLGCSVACLKGGEVVSTISKHMARGQAEQLVPMIGDALEQGGMNFSSLDLLVTTVGPGAFTGLRIGLSTARALSLSLSIPVVGCTTLEVVAEQYFGKKELPENYALMVLIETKRQDYYVQFYSSERTVLSDPVALEGKDILSFVEKNICKPCVVIGDAAQRFQASVEESRAMQWQFKKSYELPDPAILAMLGMQKFKEFQNQLSAEQSRKNLQPLYLRGADVSMPKKTQRKISCNE